MTTVMGLITMANTLSSTLPLTDQLKITVASAAVLSKASTVDFVTNA